MHKYFRLFLAIAIIVILIFWQNHVSRWILDLLDIVFNHLEALTGYDFTVINYALVKGLPYLPNSLLLSFLGAVIGFMLAIILTMMRISRIRFFKLFVKGWVFFFRGTPFLGQVFLFWYGIGGALAPVIQGNFPEIWAQDWFKQLWQSPFAWAVIVLACNSSAYGAEILRGGLLSVHNGQTEAAKALGMNRKLAFFRIRLPQAIAQAIPAYSNECILVIKATVTSSAVLPITDLWSGYQKANTRYFEVFEPLIIIGLIYFLISFAMIYVFKSWEHKLNPWIYKNRNP